MKYKVVVSEDAKNSILDSMRFLANVNKDTAKKEMDDIFNQIATLEEFPLRHQTVKNLIIFGKPVNKFVLSDGRYIVLYTVDKSSVCVDKFLDSRKENKLINDLLE